MMFNQQLTALLLAASLATASPAVATAQRPVPSGHVAAGMLSFDGRATLGDFTGITRTVAGEMTGGPDLSAVQGWVEAPVRSLLTGKAKRDADLLKSMEADKYPFIRYELTGATPGIWAGDTALVTLHGRFVIHGVTRDADLMARLAFSGDQINLRADTPLNLKDYRIGGLSRMLGLLVMQEEIMVHVDVTFAAGEPPRRSELTRDSSSLGE